MKKIEALTFIFFIGLLYQAKSQEYPAKELDLDNFIQQIFPVQNEDLPYEELYENLLQYYQSPLDLNKASREQLGALFVLSELQINSFLKYREQQGRLMSIYELQVIEGFDLNTIYHLLPFVKIPSTADYKDLSKRLFRKGDNYFILRYERLLEKKRGMKDSEKGFLGSPDKIYGRFRSSHSNQYSIGLTFEKDQGEPLSWSPATKKYGFDYLSSHFYLKNIRRFKSLIIGDYQLQFGQGLLFGAGFSAGKGGETVSTLRRYNLGIRPYTSAMENGFFRGSAFTYSIKKHDFTLFYSSVNEDASVKADSSGEDYATSIKITGLHRTHNELEQRKRFNHLMYGCNFNSTIKEGLTLGLTFVNTDFEAPIQKKATRYNYYDFKGDHNYVYSANLSWIFQNFNLFGEAAQSKSKGTGIVTGVISSLSSKVDLSMIYRNYSKSFHSFYGDAFGENTRNANEEGIYAGIKVTPIKKIVFSAYFDRYYKPWLSFQTSAPSHGHEYLSRISFIPSKTVNIYLQYRSETNEINLKGDKSIVGAIENQRRENFLLNLDFQPQRKLHVKCRYQLSSIHQGNYRSKGMLLYTDIVLDLGKYKVSSRYSLFDTDDYTSRIYAYEKDVLYTYSFPAMYGQGIRNFIMVEYSLSKSIEIWIRAGRTTYNNVESIGSGLDKIDGNKRTDVKFQIRYKI